MNLFADVNNVDKTIEDDGQTGIKESCFETRGDAETVVESQNLTQQEKIEQSRIFGLFVPFLTLVPGVQKSNAIQASFHSLQKEERALKLAAAHIEDALSGRGKFGKARAYFQPSFPQRCFYVYSSVWYARFLLLVVVGHAVSLFYEPPSVEKVHPVVFFVSLLCLLIYCVDLIIHIAFLEWHVFWSKETEESYWNGVQFVLVSLFFVDFLLLCAGHFANMYMYPPFRCFRLVIVLCKVKNVRIIFDVLLTIMLRILKMSVIIIVFIMVFACVGVHWYMDVYNEIYFPPANQTGASSCCVNNVEEPNFIGAFDNFAIAMLRLFVLLSTENYPMFMLPAFRKNEANFFFFGIFIFVGVFFLTAILLAVIVDSYWLDAKKHVKKTRARERAELAKAWNLIDPDGFGAVNTSNVKFLKIFQLLKPKNTDEQNQILIELLDSNQNGSIDSFEWMTTIKQVLEAEFEENPENHAGKNVDGVTTLSKIQETSKELIETDWFSRYTLVLIFIHILLFSFKWKGQSKSAELTVQGFRTVVIGMFMAELLLKTFGLGKKLLQPLEFMDVTLTFVATIFNFLTYGYNGVYRNTFVIISSLCVFMRLFLNSAQTRHAFRWFMDVVPVMTDLTILLVISIYLLAVIGMECFHDSMPTSEEDMEKMYSPKCGVGFNTFACSLIILFQILSTSNWHDVMNTVFNRFGHKTASVYFIIVYVVITMMIMNVFVAIAIEAANKLGRKETDPGFDKEKAKEKSPKTSIKTKGSLALHHFADMIFRTARTEDVTQRKEISQALLSSTKAFTGQKRRRNSTTLILKQPVRRAGKKISIITSPKTTLSMLQQERNNDGVSNAHGVKTEGVSQEISSRTTAKEKHREKMKKRVKERKERNMERNHQEKIEIEEEIEVEEMAFNPQHTNKPDIARVVAPFHSIHRDQLNVNIGDTVNVLDKVDDWVYAEMEGTIGWIPATHLVSVYHNNPGNDLSSNGPPIVMSRFHASQMDETAQQQRGSVSDNLFNAQSNSKHKIKMKRAGDWTRDILGDITIMNAEEMRELNKVMRAELKAPSSSIRRKLMQQSVQSGLSVVSEDAKETGIISTSPTKLLQPQTPSWHISHEREKSPELLLPLTVRVDEVKTPSPSPPTSPTGEDVQEGRLQPPWRAKPKIKANKDGSPPEWIKKFALTNNLVLGDDVKISSSLESLLPVSLKRKRSASPVRRSSVLKIKERCKKGSAKVSPKRKSSVSSVESPNVMSKENGDSLDKTSNVAIPPIETHNAIEKTKDATSVSLGSPHMGTADEQDEETRKRLSSTICDKQTTCQRHVELRADQSENGKRQNTSYVMQRALIHGTRSSVDQKRSSVVQDRPNHEDHSMVAIENLSRRHPDQKEENDNSRNKMNERNTEESKELTGEKERLGTRSISVKERKLSSKNRPLRSKGEKEKEVVDIETRSDMTEVSI